MDRRSARSLFGRRQRAQLVGRPSVSPQLLTASLPYYAAGLLISYWRLGINTAAQLLFTRCCCLNRRCTIGGAAAETDDKKRYTQQDCAEKTGGEQQLEFFKATVAHMKFRKLIGMTLVQSGARRSDVGDAVHVALPAR